MEQEVKSLLKSAKESLKAKEYNEVLKVCKVNKISNPKISNSSLIIKK